MQLPPWNELGDIGLIRHVFERAGHKIGARRCRLFICACCRRIPGVLDNEVTRGLLELAERAADGKVKQKELKAAARVAAEKWRGVPAEEALISPQYAALGAVGLAALPKTLTWGDTWRASASISGYFTRQTLNVQDPRFSYVAAEERRGQASVLAHILGDPHHPLAEPDTWPTAVPKLAQALYDGQPCHFALHDALTEAGLTEWAEHFRDANHPRGCWALDVILGKK
jgi:hypothetical protein